MSPQPLSPQPLSPLSPPTLWGRLGRPSPPLGRLRRPRPSQSSRRTYRARERRPHPSQSNGAPGRPQHPPVRPSSPLEPLLPHICSQTPSCIQGWRSCTPLGWRSCTPLGTLGPTLGVGQPRRCPFPCAPWGRPTAVTQGWGSSRARLGHKHQDTRYKNRLQACFIASPTPLLSVRCAIRRARLGQFPRQLRATDSSRFRGNRFRA
jgi:hypothetical protein